jgi:transposase-like protein
MKSEIATCNHIHLVKQTGPMDGRSASKRYVCQDCPTQFMAELYEKSAHFGTEAMTDKPQEPAFEKGART